MFKGQPKGLFALALANTGERFGYYTMLAIFTLYMRAKFGWDENMAGQVYAIFLAGVYFMPLIGGMIADRIGYGKCVTLGAFVMIFGYLALAVPMATRVVDKWTMFTGLGLIAIGTGLFKGNLQVLVGNLYDEPKYSSKRDAAFSLFYMAINLGAMFAPAMAKALYNPHIEKAGYYFVPIDNATVEFGAQSGAYLQSLAEGYRLCFYVACVSLVISLLIYFFCRPWFKHADVNTKQAKAKDIHIQELTPEQTKARIVALLLVFAVVIFFWMAFHQNGSALTFFADKYTKLNGITGINRIWFNIWSLALIAVSVYTLFGMFQSETKKSRLITAIATLALWAGAIAFYMKMPASFNATTSDFQQFNPFFVVALTPISVVSFGALAKKGKEPSAPVKIGMGMMLAGVGFAVITVASAGLTSPKDLGDSAQSILNPNWLIGTYFTLTVAELLLSPMGISFVSKVAPPKYKGLMMGGWFAASAIGNYLSRIPSALWNKISLMANWGILIALCVTAGLIMFLLRKKLEAATQD
ncbi:MAG TPA: peptide MFS transporter [Bacteroidaceae bacterium]|jgi:POT family proton-dependent oligopeptide transporter|nr:MAG: Di-/tripeptide transporter [Bacteroidetes bacterium ADurb.BinA104]HOD67861.1 peptide MFS transporter [Bacteroidaceae bacterium]HPB03226.1 peptide MFS transporter [Bacteroidaceae bacterium]HQL25398.1 peptide MFS transporter [Bacteroidaceae bacterium]